MALRTPTQIAILRVLAQHPTAVSARDLAPLLDDEHRTRPQQVDFAWRELDELSRLGLIIVETLHADRRDTTFFLRP